MPINGHVRFGYNRHDVPTYYAYQRGNHLGWDIFGNVQRFGYSPYWSGHETNKNIEMRARLHEATSPTGPVCEGNLMASRVGNVEWCVAPIVAPTPMPELTLWSGRAPQGGQYR